MKFGQTCAVCAVCNVKGYLWLHGGYLWVQEGYLSILGGHMGGSVGKWVNQVGG